MGAEMLNKFGVWNRLALVVGILFAFTLPTWVVYEDNEKSRKLTDDGFQACMANEHFVSTDGKSQFTYCWDFWHDLVKPSYPSWDEWWIMVFGTAVAGLIVYGLCWIVIATGKWIWRGREVGKGPSPVRATPKGETD